MLGGTPLTSVLGSGVDNTDPEALRGFIRAACGEGLALMILQPGSKIPADMRTPHKRRADDNAETVAQRLESYHAQTAPLIDYYQSRGALSRVPAMGAIEDIAAYPSEDEAARVRARIARDTAIRRSARSASCSASS